MKKVSAVFFAAAAAAAAAVADDQSVQVPEPELAPLSGLEWKLPAKYAALEGDRLVVDIPAGAYPADAMATARLPLPLLEGAEGFSMTVEAEGFDLAKPTKSWLGLKFQLHWKDAATGREDWPNVKNAVGGLPAGVLRNDISFGGARPGFAELELGLQGTSGRVVFDLSTLRGGPSPGLFRRINGDWRVRYPEPSSREGEPSVVSPSSREGGPPGASPSSRECGLPVVSPSCREGGCEAPHSRSPLRGFMLPARDPTEADFEELARLGATLVRYQMVRNWNGVDDNRDLPEYAAWVDGKLERLESVVLPCARKHGMKVVVDLHVTPGGRDSMREMAMFRDERYADAFVETWRRIAARFRGNSDVVYGYDLVNEPVQLGRAPIDYWTLQRRAAEAVRAIDPDTAIIVESNGWDAPATFSYLSPLRMDNVIYQVHCYAPMEFTHQGVGGRAKGPAWPDPAKGWDRDFVRETLAPVREFAERTGARIYVGEFSAIAWAPGAENYLRDCIAVFEECGWDWTYHAFREWSPWSVEHEGPDAAHMVPSADNPRKRALLDGLRGVVAPPAAPPAAAVDWDGAMLVGRLAGRDDPFFAPGEEMVFEIRLEGAKGEIPPDTYFVDWERRGDDGLVEKGRAPLPAADAPLVVRTKSDKPGFVCIEANVVTADGRRVPKNHRWEKRVFFQGGAAVAPETLRPGAEPADYHAIWDAQMARLAATPVRAELAPAPCADSGVRLYAVRVDCAGGRPVTGWLTVPADASPTNRHPAEVSYRGASKDDQPPPETGPHDRIRFESNGHGFDLGKGPEYVKTFFDSVRKPGMEYGFDPESNADREKSYWLGMALRAVRALEWIVTLPEWDGRTLALAAGSQGGWQALMAASRFPRVTRISTSVTWGCDWTGQAEFGRLPSTYRPKCWFPAMAYFDAVFAARRIACPVEIEKAGLGDYVSPPSSLAVLYNELRGPKKITWRQGWTHGWQPGGMASWTVDGGYGAAAAQAAAPAPSVHDDGTLAAP